MQVRYYRYPDDSSKFTEELQAGLASQTSVIDEEEDQSAEEQNARAMALEEQKNQSRVSQLKEAAVEAVEAKAKQIAKEAVKSGVKSGAKLASRGIIRFLFATPTGWWILGILAAIILIVGLIIFLIVSITNACNTESKGWGGWAVSVAFNGLSTVADNIGFSEYAFCKQVGGLSGGNQPSIAVKNANSQPVVPGVVSDLVPITDADILVDRSQTSNPILRPCMYIGRVLSPQAEGRAPTLEVKQLI
ncbi:MAG: hypothetical protein KW793_01430 [Candidatus Doudnabacteria bacterium]|nr:hypothetical protein [Candidatus Doudnabacteria bacterium]